MEVQRRTKGNDTPGGSHVIRLHSNSRFAVNKRQKELKSEMVALPVHKLAHLDGSTFSAIIGRVTRQAKLFNDARREGGDEKEIWFTLVDGLKPIKHRIMSRKVDRNLNFGNRRYKTGMQWVQGKQDIQKP